MILAFDTYYYANNVDDASTYEDSAEEHHANTVCVSFSNWTDAIPTDITSEIISGVQPYESGAFYKRELPCILSLLDQYALDEVSSIIVDGYVILDDKGKLGLGGYLFEVLEGKIPVIGVAKSKFKQTQYVCELKRGVSKNPLYISTKGMTLDDAVANIAQMHGKYRMPTLLQVLDSNTKMKT